VPDSTPAEPTRGGVAEIERVFLEGRRKVARLHLLARLGSITMACLVLGYLWSIVAFAGEAYAPARFEPHLRTEVERLVPEVRAHANAVFSRVGPVYARLAQEKIEKALPALQESLRTELESMGGGIAERTGPRIRETLDRLEEKQWERLGAAFPSLRTDASRQAFADRWSGVIIEDHRRLLADFDLRFGKHAIDLHRSLEGFRPNRFESWDEERLTRHFVHLWLQLLDRHILSLDDPQGHDDAGREAGDGR